MYRAGYPRVTHPSAALYRSKSLDLHVLGTPPAFILSQDQTLKINSSNLYRQRYIFATASDTYVAQINLITCSDYHYLNIWLGLLVSILLINLLFNFQSSFLLFCPFLKDKYNYTILNLTNQHFFKKKFQINILLVLDIVFLF